MKRRVASKRGQALVEFAMVMPVFVLLLFALLDFGRVVYAMNTVNQASREAARFAAIEHSTAKYGEIRALAIRMAPGIGLNNGDVTGAGCADCFYPDGTLPGGRAVVRVTKSIELITPLLGNLLGGSFVVDSESRGYIP